MVSAISRRRCRWKPPRAFSRLGKRRAGRLGLVRRCGCCSYRSVVDWCPVAIGICPELEREHGKILQSILNDYSLKCVIVTEYILRLVFDLESSIFSIFDTLLTGWCMEPAPFLRDLKRSINFVLSNILLTFGIPEFIEHNISHSRFVSFDNAFMIDFTCVRKYFIHRECRFEYAANDIMPCRPEWCLPMAAVEGETLAFETYSNSKLTLAAENIEITLATDGQSPCVGVVLASITALTSLSVFYLTFARLLHL